MLGMLKDRLTLIKIHQSFIDGRISKNSWVRLLLSPKIMVAALIILCLVKIVSLGNALDGSGRN